MRNRLIFILFVCVFFVFSAASASDDVCNTPIVVRGLKDVNAGHKVLFTISMPEYKGHFLLSEITVNGEPAAMDTFVSYHLRRNSDFYQGELKAGKSLLPGDVINIRFFLHEEPCETNVSVNVLGGRAEEKSNFFIDLLRKIFG